MPPTVKDLNAMSGDGAASLNESCYVASMFNSPDIVLLGFDSDVGYAKRLAATLSRRIPDLRFTFQLINKEALNLTHGSAFYILLLGPYGPSENFISTFRSQLRRLDAGDQLIEVASHLNRSSLWRSTSRIVDRTDWHGEPDPAMVMEVVELIAFYRKNADKNTPTDITDEAKYIIHSDPPIHPERYLLFKIADIEFSNRTYNSLKNVNINYVGDLVQKTEAEVIRIPNLGRKSLSEIKAVLSSMGLSLGLSLIGWTPDNIEQELARIAAARSAADLQQKPGGATFAARGDQLAIDTTGDDSDRQAAERPITRQMHEEVQRKAREFSICARRLDNQTGWGGIGRLGEKLERLLSVPIEEIPDVLGYLYPAALELGSFLEMDNALLANAASYAAPLDSEVRRPLDDLVRTFAPWLRGFPTVRQMDDDAGRFLARQSELPPTTAIIQAAREIELISEYDAAVLRALTAAAARGDFQGDKAASRVTQSVRNMVYVAASIIGSFFLGSVSSDYATKSVLVQRSGTLLANAERDIVELVADLPPDLRLSIGALVHDSLIIPQSPSNPNNGERLDESNATNRRRRISTRSKFIG